MDVGNIGFAMITNAKTPATANDSGLLLLCHSYGDSCFGAIFAFVVLTKRGLRSNGISKGCSSVIGGSLKGPRLLCIHKC